MRPGLLVHPAFRPRRLREREATRRLVRETALDPTQLVMPLFVRPGRQVRSAIPSMPGQFQLSIDQAVKECAELHRLGVTAALLFGLPERKDERGSQAYAKDGIIQQAVKAIKAAVPELLVITDVCLCAYTSHGHCGVVKAPAKRSARSGAPKRGGEKLPAAACVDNDATLTLLAKTAISHAEAGADLVAPSDMMDGNVAAIRQGLDAEGFDRIPILAYSVKFASALYGPFRQAVDSAPSFGDRRGYQMDAANAEEALREAALDIEQGADMLMVKPALPYLDIIYRLKKAFSHPVAAFSVSGEYAMVKAAAARGWIVERAVWPELLLGIRRAGADVIVTYWAKEAAKWLNER